MLTSLSIDPSENPSNIPLYGRGSESIALILNKDQRYFYVLGG